jgi:ADP-ribose pyrophosphatase YjhB (NUDIX family)
LPGAAPGGGSSTGDGQDLFAVAVAGICTSGDSVVLVRRALDDPHMPGSWGVPAGHVRRGETLEAALQREVLEETGLQVGHLRLVGTSSYTETAGRLAVPVVQLNYAVSVPRDDLQPRTRDIMFAQWVPCQTIGALPWVDDFTREVLRQGGIAPTAGRTP